MIASKKVESHISAIIQEYKLFLKLMAKNRLKIISMSLAMNWCIQEGTQQNLREHFGVVKDFKNEISWEDEEKLLNNIINVETTLETKIFGPVCHIFLASNSLTMIWKDFTIKYLISTIKMWLNMQIMKQMLQSFKRLMRKF